jgi:hypothetical protein
MRHRCLWRSQIEDAKEATTYTRTLRLLVPSVPFSLMPYVLLKVLRILHLARCYIGRTSSRWTHFIALLGRKLTECWHQWLGKPGPSRNAKPAESSLPSNGAGHCSSASGGPAVLREYVIAASEVPASATRSQGSLRLQVGAEGQSPASTAPPSPILATLSVEQSHSLNPYYLVAGNFAGRSSSNVSYASTQSRASERRTRITSSREALHAPVGQPAELPRSSHHQFGRGPDPSRSGGRLSRSPSPIPPLNRTQQLHHLDIVETGVPTHSHEGGGISPPGGAETPTNLPSSSSHTREPQSTPLNRRKQKTTSLDVHIQNPSLESLAIVSPTHLPPLTEEPMAISPTQSSAASFLADHDEIASQRPSFVASEYYMPEGRFLQLFNSEQVPRYTKGVTMQVDCSITFTSI